jgi:MFS family permease
VGRAASLLLLGSLYLAQGLPYGFFTGALPVMLREQGLSLKAISATSLLFIPWALKFLWAPAVDRIGTRRQWLLPLQLGSVLLALALAAFDPAHGLLPLLAALFLFNLIAATQDIATDGLAVRLLDARSRGLGNGLQVGGYRVGMILGGGALLAFYAWAGWSAMCFAMAALLLLASIPAWRMREAPAGAGAPPPGPDLALQWLARLRQPGMAPLIALIVLYKFGDSMVATLVGPFMKDAGLATTQIAWIKGTLGSGVTLAGAAAGGWVAFRLGRRTALLGCGLLQAASLLLYVASAVEPTAALITAASVAEHLLGGMATVALFTLMMDASDPAHAGADYTLLACALVLAQGLAQFAGATLADAFGYVPMFSAGFVIALGGCLLLVRALDRGAGPRRLAEVWPRRTAG